MHRQLLTALLVVASATPALAQDNPKKGSVLIPSELELTEEQRAALQQAVSKEVESALQKCVATYPRPEFFGSLAVDYRLKKSGRLTGGYIGGAAPDPNLYVKDDAERAKLESEGIFTRRVVVNDRDLERCMKKATGNVKTELQRYSASLTAAFDVAWSGGKPKLTATQFEITKAE